MTHHTPKPPDQEDIERFQTWSINVEQGRVFNEGHEIFNRNPASGYFQIVTWKGLGKNKRFSRAHIIWWKAYGRWPALSLDHIDRDKTNDRIDNLREATPRENSGNRTKQNELPTGVCLYKSARNKKNPYMAHAYIGGKQVYLGCFPSAEEAVAAREAFLAAMTKI